MSDIVYIYVIKDPRDLAVRYVGKTIDPQYRFRKHLTENNKTYKSKWVKGMRSLGLKPVFEVIEECSFDNWEEREVFHIANYRADGADLLNITDGGEPGLFKKGHKLPEEHRKAISRAKKGKPRLDLGEQNKATKGKKVDQFDMAGNYIATHGSLRDAAKAVNRNFRRIQAMCLHGRLGNKNITNVAGFVFKYSAA